MDPLNILAKFELHSFSRSWDNKGYTKKLGSPWIRLRDAPYVLYGCHENFRESLTTPMATFLKIFNGLLFPLNL